MFKRTKAINKILSINDRFKIVQGGSSAGKTFAIIAILIDYAIKHNNKRIDVVAQTYGHLRDGSIQDLQTILQLTKRWNDKNWNDSKKIYTFKNGSVIRFKAIDKIGKAKGPRRDVLFINEANYIPFKIVHQLISRTAGNVFIDFNPVNEFWAHTEYVNENNFIKLTYKDNSGVPNNVIKDFEIARQKAKTSEYWQNYCKVYLDGEIGIVEGQIFKDYAYVNEKIDIKDLTYLGSGMDFGFSIDPTTLIDVYRYKGQLLIDEVIYHNGNLTSDQIKDIIDKEKTLTNDYREIWCDTSDGGKSTELLSKGVRIRKAKKGPGSILFGIHKLQHYFLYLTKRSINTKKELDTYKWKENKDGKFFQEPNQTTEDHSIDALRYFAESLNDMYLKLPNYN